MSPADLAPPQVSPQPELQRGKGPPQQPRVHSNPTAGTRNAIALQPVELLQGQLGSQPIAVGQFMLTTDRAGFPASQSGLDPVQQSEVLGCYGEEGSPL